MPHNKVLYRKESPARDTALLEPFLARFAVYRRYLVVISIAIGLLLTLIDANCLLHEYGMLGPKICGAPDFAVAFRLPRNFPNFTADHTTALFSFVVAQYMMQVLLIAMAFTILFQLLLHSVAFLAFEQFKIPKQSKLAIRLNAQDQFCEFGLMEVNEAINLTYVFIAVAMAIPVLSVLNKPPGGDIGQTLMAILLPLLLFAPAIIPVFDRIMRRRKAAELVRAANNPKLIKSFREQRLWPFEQTALSYVGKICLAVALLFWLYVVTGEVKNLLKPFG